MPHSQKKQSKIEMEIHEDDMAAQQTEKRLEKSESRTSLDSFDKYQPQAMVESLAVDED